MSLVMLEVRERGDLVFSRYCVVLRAAGFGLLDVVDDGI